ncbi:hypothetical protein [Methanobacterium aggregans]|uniref:hypothetical protein n=1 Tax=Methanobacterium aggregans TaxID=1615586 RepID=UPI001AE96E03|nr:hypothetical protein [Methanobacterium aggregans]MBP2046763.1 disulfide bond formation protein DsbB [Methanobacterium aggregans]
MFNIENKDFSPGIIIFGALILLIALIPLDKPVTLTIFGIIFGIYSILLGIMRRYFNVLTISMGTVLLICILAVSALEKAPLDTFYLILSFLFIGSGILKYLGYIPEKWLN